MSLAFPILNFVWETRYADFEFSFPPSDPWMGYLLVALFLIASRVVMLIGPYEAFVRRYGGEARSWLKRVLMVRKATGLRGVYKLVIREAIIMIMPLFLALGIRIIVGHPGSVPWTKTTMIFFGIFAICWVTAEFSRALKTRRSVLAIAETSSFDSWKAGAALDALGLTANALDSLSIIGEDSTTVVEEENPGIVEGYLKAFGDGVREVASRGKEALDGAVQDQFNKNTKPQWKSLWTDVTLSVFPLIVVYLMSSIFS
jgi:hypothetical protein